MTRSVRVLLALLLVLIASQSAALAGPHGASIVPPEADLRAILSTVVIGLAGGLVMAILDGTGGRRPTR